MRISSGAAELPGPEGVGAIDLDTCRLFPSSGLSIKECRRDAVCKVWTQYTDMYLNFRLAGIVVGSTLSVGIWLSALNVAYRDVQYGVPFLIQAWLFLTPVAYPTTSIPQNLRWLTGLNPMTWVIDFSKWAMLGTGASWGVVALSIATMVALLISGLYYFYFRRVEHFFADVI
jgi:ABC-type polysaccharide/polyol phosphate export permease